MERHFSNAKRKMISGVISLNDDGSAYIVGVECVNERLNKGYRLLGVGIMTLGGSTNGDDAFFYRLEKSNDLLPDFQLEQPNSTITFKEYKSIINTDNICEVAEALDDGSRNRYTSKGWIPLRDSDLIGGRKYSFGKTRDQ